MRPDVDGARRIVNREETIPSLLVTTGDCAVTAGDWGSPRHGLGIAADDVERARATTLPPGDGEPSRARRLRPTFDMRACWNPLGELAPPAEPAPSGAQPMEPPR